MIHELLQVGDVLRLAGHSCQGLMSDYVFFLFILYAFSDQVLIPVAPYLSQNEADFMFEETSLCFEVFLTQQQ